MTKLYKKNGEWPGYLDNNALALRLEAMAKGIRNGSVAPEETSESIFNAKDDFSMKEIRITYFEKTPMPDGLILGFVLDYAHLELGYNTVVMLLDRDRMAFYRGRGNNEEEATADAVKQWKEDA